MGERFFSKKHLWVLQNGNTATIGITDFLQEKLGVIIFLNQPEKGEKLLIGERFGDIESKKTVMDLEAPIAGEVIEVNETLVNEPDAINDRPFESWFIKVKIGIMPNDMMTEIDYEERIRQLRAQYHL